jgi:cyclopropane fatty-acyl-phospholipid synthase-like methyltransferase
VKPYAEACERNRAPILAVLREVFADKASVLEIGSGTGQHAVYFGAELPHLAWQTSELRENHAGIMAWLAEAQLPNVQPPLELDVNRTDWPQQRYDAVFTCNTLHIVAWSAVERMFAGIARAVPPRGVLAVYGPFNHDGRYTSASNAQFDAWLKARDPASGIRDFANVDALARSYGFALEQDVAMPANNRTLVWRRLSENAA